MAPAAFLQRPVRWLNAISRYGASRSGGPNFAYDLCVRRVAAEERRSLDLTTWHSAYCGAEPIRHDTLRAFASAFAPCGFRSSALRPCFGLAEATLLVTAGRWAEAGSTESLTRVVRPGWRYPGGHRRTRDQATRGPGGGEIWVAGPGVARVESSGGTQHLWRADRSGRRPVLDGDLGFIHGGALHVSGRLKMATRHEALPAGSRADNRTASAIRPGCSAAFTTKRIAR
jgi:acyl-CoA synthetase (AMP-forming)/AMP-acid ligase II